MHLTRCTLPVLAVLVLVLCVSAKSFTATCTYNEKAKSGKKSRRVGRRRGYGIGSQVKGSAKTRPAFYGVKTNTVDVVLYSYADAQVTTYINGETREGWATENYHDYTTIAGTLTGGDVLSFVANDYGGPYGLIVSLDDAGGERTLTTTGRKGWKGVPFEEAEDGWMEAGFDDSDWPDLVPSEKQTAHMPLCIVQTGLTQMWTSVYSGKIAVRFAVPTPTPAPTPTPNPQCACTEGACDDGTCHYCLFNQGDGRLVCYQDWPQDACDDAGSAYTWCGN